MLNTSYWKSMKTMFSVVNTSLAGTRIRVQLPHREFEAAVRRLHLLSKICFFGPECKIKNLKNLILATAPLPYSVRLLPELSITNFYII
jgi:hypothetical protein